MRGLLLDFPYVLEFFLLSRAVCEEGKSVLKPKHAQEQHGITPVRSLRSSLACVYLVLHDVGLQQVHLLLQLAEALM